MEISVVLSVFLFSAITAASEDIDSRELRCLVCRTTIDELQHEIQKVDPLRQVDVGQYRLDDKGNAIQKKIPLAKSEIFISDTLDTICNKLDDYVRARYKSSGHLVLLNLLDPSGGMNPEMSKVDIIQDGDLNKSLKFLCEAIVEEFEESIISIFQSGRPSVRSEICKDETKFCDDDVNYTEDNLYEEEIEKTEL